MASQTVAMDPQDNCYTKIHKLHQITMVHSRIASKHRHSSVHQNTINLNAASKVVADLVCEGDPGPNTVPDHPGVPSWRLEPEIVALPRLQWQVGCRKYMKMLLKL